MSQQFVAVVTTSSRTDRRNSPPGIGLLRFDRESDFEIVQTGESATGIASVTRATAMRMLSGRTVIVSDRTEANAIDSVLGLLGDIDVVTIDELRSALLLGDRTASSNDVSGQLESIAASVRESIARIGEYDTLTLNRAAGLASAAGWSLAALLRNELDLRDSLPVPLHHDYPYGSHEIAFLGTRERPEPLKRTGDTDSIPADYIDDMLGPSGSFSRIMLGYERRKAQHDMADAVARVFNDDGWLLVEAGTGTGKSVAYLAPAARFALRRGERVVISTNTKALQDQLILKDVPDVQRALAESGESRPLKSVVLKGRSNYLCLRRWFAHERQAIFTPADAGLRAKVNLWLPLTPAGDRSELRLTADEEGEFSRVSAEGEVCNAAKCAYQQRNQCFLFRARRNAENAHLVIVNHALLLSDSGDAGSILPDYERLVIDEAHHLEDQATSQFGMTIQELAIAELLDIFVRMDGVIAGGLLAEAAAMLGRNVADERDLKKAAEARDRLQPAQALSTRVRSVGLELFARIRMVCEGGGAQDMGYGRTLRITPAIRRSRAWSEIEIEFDRLNNLLAGFEEQLRWYLAAVHEQHPDKSDEEAGQDPFEDIEIEIGAGIDRGMEIAANLAEAVLSPLTDRVYWISLSASVNRLSLNAAPLHVGEMLRATLFERMSSVVLTSATLTTDDSFAFVKDRLSVGEAEELSLESPFDYRKSAMLYLVDDVPEPNQPGYQQVLEHTIIDLGLALEGQTLVLFTSHAALRATHRAIKQTLANEGITVLAQRADGSPRQLIEQFKSSSRTILLGTSTFWEGVDVVGPALSALVIAKLPFAVPSDPVIAARSEQFEEPFRQYSIPRAVLRFKQGFGRLIRSSSDRGICVVLDRRTISKRYGASFVQSLPHCTVRVGAAIEASNAAVDWLDRKPIGHPARGNLK